MTVSATTDIAGSVDHVRQAAHVLARNPLSTSALLFIVLLIAVAAMAPWIVPYDPNAVDLAGVLQPPSAAPLFGPDQVGRAVLSRVLVAARLDLAYLLIDTRVALQA